MYTVCICVCIRICLCIPLPLWMWWGGGGTGPNIYIYIHIYLYIYVFIYLFTYIYIHIYIVYINVDNMVFIYHSHQMVMPISALPKSLVSIVRNLRIHFEKRCVEWLGRASKTWVSQGGVRRKPFLQITVPSIISGSSIIMPPGVSSSYAFCVKAISVSFA